MTSPFNHGKAIDVHTHVVSLDPSSGCYLSPALRRRPFFRFLRWRYGINGRQDDAGRLWSRFERSFGEMGEIGHAVILALDAVYNENGKLDWGNTHFYIPNDYVFHLAKENPRLLPGASVHPNRRDALDELERCRERGAVLIKWLPNTQGFDPADPRYHPFLKTLKRLSLPLLCHTGPEHSLNSINQDLGNPLGLKLALEEGVTVIAAHGGGAELFNDRYFDVFLEMLLAYPNLYTDTSALLLPHRKRYLIKLLKRPEVHHKLIHGSDFPLPVSAWGFVRELPLQKIWQINRTPNPIRRDYLIKKEMGFPAEVFTRGRQILPHCMAEPGQEGDQT